ncbi:MAG: tetratricopeptide repeat protein [Silvibacterium sp.]|nr:tetratricopeptide repeat protein [Silvibacterium sp.]
MSPLNSLVRAFLLAGALAAAGQNSPQSFDQLSTSAQHAYESDHPEEAAKLYTEALKLRPDWAQGWWALGMIAYEGDRYSECSDALTRMVALDASAAPGWDLLGLCEFRTKQYEKALEHLKRGHMLVSPREQAGPLHDMANYHLAMLLTRQGAFEVAQEIFAEVALKVRDNPDMVFAAGLSALRLPILPSEVPADRRDVVGLAGKTFWDVVNQPPAQAESDFKTLVATWPNIPNVHYFYGTYLAAHHPEQCATEFLTELRVSPDSVPARVQLALRNIVEQKPDDAFKMAKEAVALSPDSVGAQLALGEALRAQGNDQRSLSAYLEARRLDPSSPKIRLYLVNVYRALGRTEEMRREQTEYNRLKTEQPNWP